MEVAGQSGFEPITLSQNMISKANYTSTTQVQKFDSPLDMSPSKGYQSNHKEPPIIKI